MASKKIGIVGPCGAGKTTLAAALRQLGFTAKAIAQEHSYVPDMWQRISKPDLLIYLDVSYPLTIERRKLNWNLAEYEEQLHRLRHARQSAAFTIFTNPLTPEEVLQQALAFIQTQLTTPDEP